MEDNGNNEFTAPSPYKDGKREFKTIERELTGSDLPSYTLYADDFNLQDGAVIGYKFKFPGEEKCVYDEYSKGFNNDIGNEEGTNCRPHDFHRKRNPGERNHVFQVER